MLYSISHHFAFGSIVDFFLRKSQGIRSRKNHPGDEGPPEDLEVPRHVYNTRDPDRPHVDQVT